MTENCRNCESLRAEVAKLQGERDEAQGANIINRNAVKRLQTESERRGKALEWMAGNRCELAGRNMRLECPQARAQGYPTICCPCMAREALTSQPPEENEVCEEWEEHSNRMKAALMEREGR